MRSSSIPSLDAAIAELQYAPTDSLIEIASKVNKLAKTPGVGDCFTRLNYLWKDAAISILLTARPECGFVFAGPRPDGVIGMTVSTASRRTDVHCYPWHLSAKAESLVRKSVASLPVVSPILADRLAAALAA